MGIKSTETGPPHMKTWFVTGYIKSSGKRIDYSMNGPGKTRKEVNRWEKKTDLYFLHMYKWLPNVLMT